MTLFDAYVLVDWSSRNGLSPSTPRRDAIWVGELAEPAEATETYRRSREQASAHVRERLLAHARAGRRVLVGFDFPYGYPAGLASCLGLGGGTPWRAMWDLLAGEVIDDHRNRSNRFGVASRLNRRLGAGPGPFWGCPASATTPHLSATRNGRFAFPFAAAGGRLERLRVTERAMGRGVQETWKLAGAGSVGSQSLVGIPRVRALRDDPELAGVSAVWPFETGFASAPVPADGPWILHAEIWPGIIPGGDVGDEAAATGAIRDQAQVRLMCRRVRERDRDGTLGAWLDPVGLDDRARRGAVEEEGWILGCPAEAGVGGGGFEPPKA